MTSFQNKNRILADYLHDSGSDQLRSACDLMNLFFIFDEHSDKCEADEVWKQVDIIMDALHHPDKPRPEGEWIGGEVARQ